MLKTIAKLVVINTILAIGAYAHYILERDDVAIRCLFVGLGLVALCQLLYLIQYIKKFL